MYFPSRKPDLVEKNIIKLSIKKLKKANKVRFAPILSAGGIPKVEPKPTIQLPQQETIKPEPIKVATPQPVSIEVQNNLTQPEIQNVVANPAQQNNAQQQMPVIVLNQMPIQQPTPENNETTLGYIYRIIKDNTYGFIKENYGFVLITILLIILLYIRYIEVQNKKKKNRVKVIDISDDD
jgi:hypothetical protein